jgi:dolichyl-phosphate beta-glucosyltransferase
MSKEIDISIVIPAYNEAKRLPRFLEKVICQCNSSKRIYSIIIVDDGSSDKTFEIALSYKDKFCDLDVINIKKNRGKGYAVKRGLLKASGKICVFLDADGSVSPGEIEKNLHYITEDGYDIFIGSRVIKDKTRIVRAKWYRKLIGTVFNFFVHVFLFKNIKDTQCGFKMFRKDIVKPLFSRGYLRGFGFDMEILYLAYKMGYKIKEGAVSWNHVAGSKVNILKDAPVLFFNIFQIRNWHCTPINPYSKYLGPDEYRYMYELENYHWWFVSRRDLAVRLINSLKKSSSVILDVGAGTGGNLLAFGKLGKSFGIDASERAVKFCGERGLKNVIQSAAEKINYADKTFDIITCLDVLEHVINPVEVLLEMKRVLKDDGTIIIMVPAFRILWSQHDEALCHLRRYESDSLSSDLQEAELKIKKAGHFFFIAFFAVAPIRIIRRFFVAKGKMYSDTTTLPPKFLNEFMKFLLKIEMRILDLVYLPFGTTLYAITSKQ